MPGRLRAAGREILALRNVDAYAAVLVAVVLALLTLVGDAFDRTGPTAPGEPLLDKLRWAAALAALAVLVFRSVAPPRSRDRFDEVADDRSGYDRRPLRARWSDAREVCVFAPSGVNLLSPQNSDLLRRTVLARPDGRVRIIVLDGEDGDAVALASRQLDDELDYPMQRMGPSLQATTERLRTMAAWPVSGTLEYRSVGFNPGFSLVLTDPGRRGGVAVVEFHGFHNETTEARMHLEITREVSDRWLGYWTEQFEHMWRRARSPSPMLSQSDGSGPSE